MELRDWLIPKEERFFDLLETESELVRSGAGALVDLLENYSDISSRQKEIKRMEHEADGVVHSIFEALNKSFITPIDREDITALARSLDDVLDLVHHTSVHLVIYSIPNPTPPMVRLARLLREQTEHLYNALHHLRDPSHRRKIPPLLVEIHRCENEADEISNSAIADLFGKDDFKWILKMRDIYRFLEAGTDRAEDAADVLRDLIVKYP